MSKGKKSVQKAKSHMHYLFHDMVNKKNLDRNNVKINKKSQKNILLYDIDFGASNSIKPLYVK